MPDEAGGRSEQSARRKPSLKSLLLPLFGVTGALLAMVLVYLSYDYISVRSFPCDAIFRQASLGLSTKISFLKTKGEVKIGREPMVELSERAQMAALNLKTCCTVLDAGRLNAEEFLQCKAKARAYEFKLDEILSVVQRVARQQESSSSSGGVHQVWRNPPL